MSSTFKFASGRSARMARWGSVVVWSLVFSTLAVAADASGLASARRAFDDGRYPEARSALEQIVAAEPRNAEALFYLGWTSLRLDRPEAAVASLERAVAIDNAQSRYFRVLGDACGVQIRRASFFTKLGWARRCLAAYNRAVALDPDNVDARVARMGYYWHAPAIAGGGMDKARAEAEEIRRRDPVRGAQALADLLVSEKKYAEAFAVIDDLVARNPGNMPAHYQLGRLAAISGRQLERGTAALQTYLRHTPQGAEPSLAAAHWRLGMIHEKAGDRAAARADYEAALRLAPDFSLVRDALAKLR